MITKEQWAEIEAQLARLFAHETFVYKGAKIQVQRQSLSESQTALIVYIDGTWKGSWIRPDSEDRPDAVSVLYRKRIVKLYSPAKRNQIIKQFGKKKALEYFPNLYKESECRLPDFPTAKALVRAWKKVPELELAPIETPEAK